MVLLIVSQLHLGGSILLLLCTNDVRADGEVYVVTVFFYVLAKHLGICMFLVCLFVSEL